MKGIKFDHSQYETDKVLGISPERAEEMMSDAIFAVEHADNKSDEEYDVLELFVKQAKNMQEVVLQSFVAAQFYANRLRKGEIDELE